MIRPSRLVKVINGLASLVIAFSLSTAALAQGSGGDFTAQPLSADSMFDQPKGDSGSIQGAPAQGSAGQGAGNGLVSVIVKLRGDSLASYKGGIPGLAATSPTVTGAPALDVNSRDSQAYLNYLAGQHATFGANAQGVVPDAKITQHFDVVLNGVAMVMPADQVANLANVPGVESIYVDEMAQLDTFRSPTFIGAPTTWAQLGGQASAGEGVIVGVLDSGIWPENPAFSDPDPAGKPYAAPPGGPYTCDFSSGTNPGAPFTCNNKLIGAYRYLSTYAAVIGLQPYEFTSARDDDGHGTHTASTAAGNGKVPVTLAGNDLGLISGIAPRAHIISYKVCGEQGCFGSDRVSAIQQSILDGVDVLNHSISGGQTPYSDAVSLAFLDAYNAGVFVSWSAGNSGPGADTVNPRAPWVASVAASTHDRGFFTTATLVGASGNLALTGASLTPGITTPTAVVDAANFGDALCLTPFAPGTFSGQIVICRRGIIARVDKSANVAAGGAGGLFLYNPATQGTNADLHSIPSVHFEAAQGTQLLSFMAANPGGVTATFPAGSAGAAQGDVMAGFSSRGGPAQTLGVSKPDITAPGVNILAGYTGIRYGNATPIYNFVSGTSMSAPHIAGAAALLRDLYPSWTPGQIKSALMTTARTDGLVKENGVTPATPFDAGSGRVDLRYGWDPGLTFDASGADYLALQNELWHANYPSLYVPTMPGLITVERTAQEVSGYDSDYYSRIEYPAGQPRDFQVSVPAELFIHANDAETFHITVDARDVPIGQVRHATIVWTEKHVGCVVRMPVTIVRRQPSVTMTKSCDPASLPLHDLSACSIVLANNGLSDATVSLVDRLPAQLEIEPGSVSNATQDSSTQLSFSGVLPGALPPDVSIGVGTSPNGYLPLSGFGVTPVAGVTDDSVINFNTPAFVYAGETYSRVGFGSNGTLIVGGATSSADATFINQNLPDPTAPNNVLAPFWTDLNPAAGGALRIATLSDGTNTWIVADWEAVREFGSGLTNSFQVWIRIGSVEDITFVYGTLNGNGDGGFLTVGAENRFGNRGGNYYFDGTGTLPTSTTELRVTGTPPTAGAVHTITFEVVGVRTGAWVNYAEMTGNTWFGINIARFAGEVTP